MSESKNDENIDGCASKSITEENNDSSSNSISTTNKGPKRRYKLWNKDKIEIVKQMLSIPETQRMKIRDISKLVDMSIASVNKIRQVTFPDTIGGPLKDYPIQRKGCKKKNLSNIESKILDLLEDNNTLTINEIIRYLPAGSPRNEGTIRKYLKNLRLSKKRASIEPENMRYDPDVITLRNAYCSKMLNIPVETLFFFDETSIDSQDTPVYAWAPLDVTPSIFIPPSKGKCVSFLCTIGMGGPVNHRIVEGRYSTKFLLEYMADLVGILPNNAIIVMDDVPMHTGNLMDGFKSRIEYLPPHSRHLFPIAAFFDVVKNEFEAIHPPPATRADIIANISTIITQHDRNSFLNFYASMRKFLELDASH
ncbi:unnamed protein product [Gordionus sp. m RMFG-2023]